MAIPETYKDKLEADRIMLYNIRDTLNNAILELLAGNAVVSYSIQNRSCTRTKANLPEMKEFVKQIENQIFEIEALLNGRSPRAVVSHSYLSPSNAFWFGGVR